eukprot:14613920-Alexandrium_andersonii.AAC.1
MPPLADSEAQPEVALAQMPPLADAPSEAQPEAIMVESSQEAPEAPANPGCLRANSASQDALEGLPSEFPLTDDEAASPQPRSRMTYALCSVAPPAIAHDPTTKDV